jgi:WD40 repeat protein/uncharacterized membrane protein
MPAFDPAFPLPIVALLVLLPAVFLTYRAFAGRQPVPRWLNIPIVLLRTATLGCIALILLNPVEPVARTVPDFTTLFIVDRSASMSLGPDDGNTRFQEALGWVDEVSARLRQESIRPPVIHTFASDLEDPGTPEAIKALVPDGTATLLASALESIADAGNPPGHVHLISDGGIHDRSALSKAIGRLRASATTISTHTVGSDTPPRNAWISRIEAPRIVRPGARVAVTATIGCSGLAETAALVLTLKGPDGGVIQRKDLPAIRENTCTFEFPVALRTADYSLELSETPGEITFKDNSSTFTVEVSNAKLRVLFVDGTHHKRKIGNTGLCVNDLELVTMAFDAAGDIEYLCLTCQDQYLQAPNLFQVSFHNGEMLLNRNVTFPTTREELYSYDVMIISDVPVGNFSKDQLQWVVDWVTERGAGFLMGGGYTTFDCGNYDKTVWEQIIPADMKAYGQGFVEEPFRMRIPKEARSHPIWHFSDDPVENDRILDSHPEWRGMVRIRRVKPGALVLGIRPDTGDEPLIAVQNYGRGRSIAYMPDPNGGWAVNFTKWAPPGKSIVGDTIMLGTGGSFRFNQANSIPPPGVVLKEHPSPYYGRFWVNVVRWLGENSIRWKRDKLAGRALATTATPGKPLPVAAEVLTVTDPAALLALDVGARLDQPGAPRVSLKYDRDRREFTGSVAIPESLSGNSVGILFDTSVESRTHSDAITTAVLGTNREFTATQPDPVVMGEIATAGGSAHFTKAEEAAAAIAALARQSAQSARESWQLPRWSRWELWAVIATLLCLEWMLRRKGNAARAAVATLGFTAIMFPGELCAETKADGPDRDIPALIQQLGDPKVRLRDEAEALLKTMPAAAPALQEAMRSHPSEEARVRAGKIIDSVTRNRWHLAADLGHGHLPGYARPPLLIAVSNDGKRFLTQGQDHACIWDAATFNPVHQVGKSNGSLPGWEGAAPVYAFAISPDGKTAITPDDDGNLFEYSTETGALRRSWLNFDQEFDVSTPASRKAVWCVSFTPDGRRIVTGGHDGRIVVRAADTLERVAALQVSIHTHRYLFFSPDARWLLAVEDFPGEIDYITVLDTRTWQQAGRRPIRDLINSLAFMDGGKRFIASGRRGYIAIWDFDPETGTIGTEHKWGNYAAEVSGIVLSADEKSIMVASGASGKALCEYELANPKILWSHTTTPGVVAIAALGPDRFITSDWDHHLRVWRKTPANTAKPPPPLVRVAADRFDPGHTYALRYEATPHAAPPNVLDALIHLPDSNLIVTRGHDKIQVSSADDLTPIRSFGPQLQYFRDYRDRASNGAIAVSQDEKTVIASDDSGVIGFYDIESGKLIRSFPNKVDGMDDDQTPEGGMLWQIVASHDGKTLYTTDRLARLRAWDIASGKLLASLVLPAIGADLKLSPDGNLLAVLTGGHAEAMQVLVSTRNLTMTDMTGISKDSHNCIGSFNGDGSFFHRPQSDGRILRFAIQHDRFAGRETLMRLPGHPLDFQVSADGDVAFAGTVSEHIPLSVWDLEKRKLLWMADQKDLQVWRIVLLPENRIACLCKDNKLRIYQKSAAGRGIQE